LTNIRLPLTENQNKTLLFIIHFMEKRGYPPTIAEVQKELGFSNPGIVFKILTSLGRKGYITRHKGEHRSIRLTKLSEELPARNQLPLFG
jgi:SOS-response transcriptional repressor LexA